MTKALSLLAFASALTLTAAAPVLAKPADAAPREIATFSLPADYYYDTYAGRVDALTLADVQRAAAEVARPNALVWIVIGDKSKVLAPLQSLGLNIKLIGPDGEPTR